ncbi:MAG TPA: NEW3 domain-containing protein [Candidatus Thermoplasmatota archaeon]|nr:NEW3 domain-containing protein [Candidatus Thermoplasmatota archaeon]
MTRWSFRLRGLATPSRLLLALVSALLVAPAVVAGFQAGAHVGTADGAAGAGVLYDRPPEGAPEPGPACCERGPWPVYPDDRPAAVTTNGNGTGNGSAEFRLHLAEREIRLEAGASRDVGFGVQNTGTRPLNVELKAESRAPLKAAAEPQRLFLQPGEARRGLLHVGAAWNASGDHAVVLHAVAHDDRCAPTQAQDATCAGLHRAEKLLVHVVPRAGEGGVRFGATPEHQRVPAGESARYHVLAYNGGPDAVTLALAARMRAPEGWSFHLASDTMTLAPGAKAETALTVTAPDGAWGGERAVVHVHAEDGAGHAWRAVVFADAVPHEVTTQEPPPRNETAAP